MNQADVMNLLEQGYKKITVSLPDGSTDTFRIFNYHGIPARYASRSRRRGYALSNYELEKMTFVKGKIEHTLTALSRFMKSVASFKQAFTVRAHKNLWSHIREAYEMLDLDELEAYIKANVKSINDYWQIHDAYRNFVNENDISKVLYNNSYATTTIKSNKPTQNYGRGQYEACLANIKRHLDNKDEFYYSWRSNYDVSVSGSTGKDGIYKAWLSLEYKGCGNGHYYLLINENSAVFAEDD